MGLGYLAGSLLAHGYEVEIWDAAVEAEIESLDDKLARDHFDVVGLSAPTPLINNAWEAAKMAKKHGPITILGGPHLTLQPHESMQKPQVDLVVRGEAEYTIIEILRALEKENSIVNSELSIVNCELPYHNSQFTIHNSQLFNPKAGWGNILGLSWRNLEGKIIHNLDRPLHDDLDAVPFPAHHLFKIDRYTNLNPLTDGLDMHARAYTVVTSRGCPYKCTYCSKPITGDTWRGRSVDNVIAEWEWLVKDLGATEIGITDYIWNLDKNRAKALCQALIKAKLNHVPWVTIQ